MVASDTGTVAVSLNSGLTWQTATATVMTGRINDLLWDGAKYLCGGRTITPGAAKIRWSVDGVNWNDTTGSNDGSVSEISQIAFNGSRYVAVAQTAAGGTATTNTVYTSPDGFTWTPNTSLPRNAWSVIAVNGVFYATASPTSTSFMVYSSPDGSSWTASTTLTPTAAAANASTYLMYANGLFYLSVVNLSGFGGTVFYATSINSTWTRVSQVGLTGGYNSIATNGSITLMAGAGLVSGGGSPFVYTVNNGQSYTNISLAGSPAEVAVVYNGRYFVATASTNATSSFYSMDGMNWFAGGNFPAPWNTGVDSLYAMAIGA